MQQGLQSAMRRRAAGVAFSDTASLKADLETASYVVSVGSDTTAPVRLEVGPMRDSGQNRPLQP